MHHTTSGFMCQKSLNFIDAFNCYKRQCRAASFNSAHPVHYRSYVALILLHCALSLAAQCIVIGPVREFVCVFVFVGLFVGLLP